MKKFVFVVLTTCLMLPTQAWAQIDFDDFYVKLGVGWASVDAETAAIGDLQDPPYDEVEFESADSPAYQLGIGYMIDELLTAELSIAHNSELDLEGPYIDNGVEQVGLEGVAELESSVIMMNILIDLATVLDVDWQLRPYLGVGAGWTRNKLGKFTLTPEDPLYIEGNTEDNFGWQAKLGITYPLGERFALDLNYCYGDYGDAESDTEARDRNGVPVTLDGPLDYDVKIQNVFLSVRYLF